MILDSFRLEGKNALVSGSTRGLGATIAMALAEAGANVGVHGRSAGGDAVCESIRKLGRKTFFAAGDVADAAVCETLIDTTIREFGSIDILINNAGIIRRAPAVEYSQTDWDEVIATDLSSVFRLSQLAGKNMLLHEKQAEISQGKIIQGKIGQGKIVNIASLLSFQGGILVPAYAAAKAGVAALTKALANEWACKGINVNAIAPGYMETDNTEALRKDTERSRQIMERIPAGRWGKPSDVTGAAVFLCSSASDYVHGHILTVDGGWMAR
jgi:2-dehydro-3-deoxy-D-gluconate 5-dehydrogenase